MCTKRKNLLSMVFLLGTNLMGRQPMETATRKSLIFQYSLTSPQRATNQQAVMT